MRTQGSIIGVDIRSPGARLYRRLDVSAEGMARLPQTTFPSFDRRAPLRHTFERLSGCHAGPLDPDLLRRLLFGRIDDMGSNEIAQWQAFRGKSAPKHAELDDASPPQPVGSASPAEEEPMAPPAAVATMRRRNLLHRARRLGVLAGSVAATIAVVAALPLHSIDTRSPPRIATDEQAPWTKGDADTSPLVTVMARAPTQRREAPPAWTGEAPRNPLGGAATATIAAETVTRQEPPAPASQLDEAPPATPRTASTARLASREAVAPKRRRVAWRRKPTIVVATSRTRSHAATLALPDVLKPK